MIKLQIKAIVKNESDFTVNWVWNPHSRDLLCNQKKFDQVQHLDPFMSILHSFGGNHRLSG